MVGVAGPCAHSCSPPAEPHRALQSDPPALPSQGDKARLLFEGVPVDDRVSLRDAGVRPRSTLVLTALPAQMYRGDDGLPVY